MGLVHDFYLLPDNNDNDDYSAYDDHSYCTKHSEGLHLHDDIILYTTDSLRWIPSINPSNPSKRYGYGLNYYGSTVINKSGADKAERIFRVWADLFQQGPETLELHGSYEWDEEDPHSGKYIINKIPRDPLVKTLSDLADYAEKAASGDHFIMHFGI